MKSPTTGQLITGVLCAYSVSLLFSYPAASVFSEPGNAPKMEAWLTWAFIQGSILSVYTAVPKSRLLLSLNPLILSALAALPPFVAWFVEPSIVGATIGLIRVLCLFTLGAPLWIPVVTLVLHISHSPGDQSDAE